jgi:hypothetical protein
MNKPTFDQEYLSSLTESAWEHLAHTPDSGVPREENPAMLLTGIREWINWLAFMHILRSYRVWLIPAFLLFMIGIWYYLESYVASVNDIRFRSCYHSKPITDMSVDRRYVYLATKGNGLQRYDTYTYVWQSFASKNTHVIVPDTLRQVHIDSLNNRLWLLTGDRDVVTAHTSALATSFEKVLKTGSSWANLSIADISTAARYGDQLVFGSHGYGAASYRIDEHTWVQYAGSCTNVQEIGITGDTVWVAGDNGVHAYDTAAGNPQLPVPVLRNFTVDHFLIGARIAVAVSNNHSLSALDRQKGGAWQPEFGGGQGLAGINEKTLTCALWDKNRLIAAVNGLGLAVYDTGRHRWASIKNGYDYRQLMRSGNLLYAALDSGLVAFRTDDTLIDTAGGRTHVGLKVTFFQDTTDGLLYATSDGGLWRRVAGASEQLFAPTSTITKQLRTLIHVLRGDDTTVWLETAEAGLLKYHPGKHKLTDGDYSLIAGAPPRFDQIMVRNNMLEGRKGTRVYRYDTAWHLDTGLVGVKDIVSISGEPLYLHIDGSISFAGDKIFGSKCEGAGSTKYFGDFDTSSSNVFLASPTQAVLSYSIKNYVWNTVPVGAVNPSQLRSFHWNSGFTTRAEYGGRCYTDTVAFFEPTPLPAPLQGAVDVIGGCGKQETKVFCAWPGILASYDPSNGKWQRCSPAIGNGDAFQELGSADSLLLLLTKRHQLFLGTSVSSSVMHWRSAPISSEGISQAVLGDGKMWFRRSGRSIGLYDPVATPDHCEQFFSGEFPGLVSAQYFVNDLWNNRIWIVGNDQVGWYDTTSHCFFSTTCFLGGNIRDAAINGGTLHILSPSSTVSLDTTPMPFIRRTISTTFPQSCFLNVKDTLFVISHDAKILELTTVEPYNHQKSTRRIFYDNQFIGDLNKISAATRYQGTLFVADEDGNIGEYSEVTHSWRSSTIGAGEKPDRFYVVAGHLILVCGGAEGGHCYYRSSEPTRWKPFTERLGRPKFYSIKGDNVSRTLMTDERGSTYLIREENDGGLSTEKTGGDIDRRFLDCGYASDSLCCLLFKKKRDGARILYCNGSDHIIPGHSKLQRMLDITLSDSAVWVLGDDHQIYRVPLVNGPVRDFSSKLPFLDKTDIFAFSLYRDRRDSLMLWVATDRDLLCYSDIESAFPRLNQRLRLPQSDTATKKIIIRSTESIQVVQQGILYQCAIPLALDPRISLKWNQKGKVTVKSPEIEEINDETDETISTQDIAPIRGMRGRFNFSYVHNGEPVLLRHDEHAFFKDRIIDVADAGNDRVLLLTDDGLFLHNAYNFKFLMKLLPENAGSKRSINELVKRGDEVWVRSGGLLMRMDIGEWRFELNKEPYMYDIAILSNCIQWRQIEPRRTDILLGKNSIVEGSSILTNHISDIAAGRDVFYASSPAGLWEYRSGQFSFNPQLQTAQLATYVDGRVLARCNEGIFIDSASDWTKIDTIPQEQPVDRLEDAGGALWTLNPGRHGIRVSIDGSDRKTVNGYFADDNITDVIFFNGHYWFASQGGIWARESRDGGQRSHFALTDRAVDCFVRKHDALYTIDANNNVFIFDSGSWHSALMSECTDTVNNGRIRFIRQRSRIRLERLDDPTAVVWANGCLAGESIAKAALAGGTLWTFSPGFGIASYPVHRFDSMVVWNNALSPRYPKDVDFFQPPNTSTIFLRDPHTHGSYWNIENGVLSGDSGAVWRSPVILAAAGEARWFIESPSSATVGMKIGQIKTPCVFTNQRLLFDDFITAWSCPKRSLHTGNALGMFTFSASPSRLVQEFCQVVEGVSTIRSSGDTIFVKTLQQKTGYCSAGRFTPSDAGHHFTMSLPTLSLRDGRFSITAIPTDISVPHPPLRVDNPNRVPLFCSSGIFTVDRFSAAAQFNDSQLLCATAAGLAEVTLHPTPLLTIDSIHEYASLTQKHELCGVSDLRIHKDSVFLRGYDKNGDDLFLLWQGGYAATYDEWSLHIFDKRQLQFNPYRAAWTQTNISFNDSGVLRLVGDTLYPLFVADDDDATKGRFSFDDVRSIWVEDNVLWAASRGGLLRYRYNAAEGQRRLVFENIYSSGTNLTTCDLMRIQTGIRPSSIDLLGHSGGGMARQTMLLGEWLPRKNSSPFMLRDMVGNLFVERDSLNLNVRVRLGENGPFIAEGLVVPQQHEKVIRIGTSIYLTDSLSGVLCYDFKANRANKQDIWYPIGSKKQCSPPQGNITYYAHDSLIVARDSMYVWYALEPSVRANPLEFGTTKNSVMSCSQGEVIWRYDASGLRAVIGHACEIIIPAYAAPFALGFKNNKTFIYEADDDYRVLDYDSSQDSYRFVERDKPPAKRYLVNRGDQIYWVIDRLGIDTTDKRDFTVGWAHDLLIAWNKDNMIFTYKGKKTHKGNPVEWFLAGSTITLPDGSFAPPSWKPKKGYLYWHGLKAPLPISPDDPVPFANSLCSVDSLFSIIAVGNRLVKIDRDRGFCEQFDAPKNCTPWFFSGSPHVLYFIPKEYERQKGCFFEWTSNHLVDYVDPGWDPFSERRHGVINGADTVRYAINARGMLFRNESSIVRTNDLLYKRGVNSVIDIETNGPRTWVATSDQLIAIKRRW